MVPEGLPSQFFVQACCTTSVFDLCDPTGLCVQYILFAFPVLLRKVAQFLFIFGGAPQAHVVFCVKVHKYHQATSAGEELAK